MASDYGLNFGFRISDESMRNSNGRLRTPASGPVLLCGTLVEQDTSAPNFLKVAAANAKPRPHTCGLLVQEEVWDRTIYQSMRIDSFERGKCIPGRLSVVTNGAGVKVWFRNTPSQTRSDGRVIPAVTMFATASVAIGRGLAWDGAKFIDVADPQSATSIGEVVEFDAAGGRVEVVLNK
jgi:hypothetical protein